MSRKARIIAEGYPHHVVHRGHNRQAVFRDNFDRDIFISMFSFYLKTSSCKLMAYCLMPNHIHLMLLPEKQDDLSNLLHRISFRYAMYFNSSSGRKGSLWESRYFSSVIVDDIYMWRAAKYICLNPVRAGIVDDPCDYHWSSAKDLLLGVRGALPISDWIEEKQRADFRDMFLDQAEVQAISQLIQRGFPYGSTSGLTKLEHITGKLFVPHIIKNGDSPGDSP